MTIKRQMKTSPPSRLVKRLEHGRRFVVNTNLLLDKCLFKCDNTIFIRCLLSNTRYLYFIRDAYVGQPHVF